jgi:photosystem II stability/assembly factor-like uncharacterized protein
VIFASVRRPLALLFAGALLVVAVLAALPRGGAAERASATACPPGFADRATRAARIERERLAERANPIADGEESVAGVDDELRAEGPLTRLEREPDCVPQKHPESKAELMRVQTESSRRTTSPLDRVKAGAYRAAVRQRTVIAQAGRTLPGGAGTWEAAGKTPLIQDDPAYPSVAGGGYGDVAGRISNFTADPGRNRVFATVGEGGVYVTEDLGKSWRPIGDNLPTNTVGALGWTPAGGAEGTLIGLTGNDVYGGGSNFAGVGAYRTNDLGRTWTKAAGIPDNVISFKVAVDPSNPNVVYAATGAGLFRSADAGASFTNVRLPVSEGVAAGQPDCSGAAPDKEGCFLANMVTDVVVTPADNDATPDGTPGAKAGSVVAAVGWRASDKVSPPSKSFPEGYVESPGNGFYRSDTGAPASFARVGTSGLPEKSRLGRMEMSNAVGPAQDHNHLYAVVQDAVRFNGGAPVIDVPTDVTGPIPNPTTLNGIYVSTDLGDTWTQMSTAEELQAPTTGSSLALTNCALLYCPGVQAWYNQFMAVDPTRHSGGVPTRIVFGLEEVWQNADTSLPQSGKSTFRVVGPYSSGTSCVGLTAKFPVCPFTAGNPFEGNFTTHADQHAAMWLPNERGGANLFVGHDGGANVQEVTSPDSAQAELSADRWTRGENVGFHTLLPYDAQVAKDGTIYAGLQDNGEMKIEPNGRQVGIYGGDGAFSAVDPDNSQLAYESYVNNDIRVTRDGGKTWTDIPPPSDTYQFINPFTMDPTDAKHILTAGTSVYERLGGPDGDWVTVFDLGTRTKPGDGAAAAGTNDPENLVSANDVRGDAGVVAFCGYCDALNARPFANGIATNVSPDGKVGKKGVPDNWHIAKATGLPERYITSIQLDPAEPRTMYATLGGYSRRWLPVGALGEADADLRPGSVWKSTDAGETFKNVTGNLPDAPANWTALRQGRLLVATNTGVYQSADSDGGTYELLGTGLPPTNVFNLEMKPKATPTEPDTMIVATQGRGVWRYVFKDPAPAVAPTASPACAATSAFKSLSVKRSGRGVRLAFTRAGTPRVDVDVFQHSAGNRIYGERLVARFRSRPRSFTWNGRANRRGRTARDGYYSVRVASKLANRKTDTRRYTFERRGGRFIARPSFYRRQSCGTLNSFKLERPVFGGGTNRALYVKALLSKRAQVRIEFRRGSRVIARTKTVTRRAGVSFRERFDAEKRPRGSYTVVIYVTQGNERLIARLSARRL